MNGVAYKAQEQVNIIIDACHLNAHLSVVEKLGELYDKGCDKKNVHIGCGFFKRHEPIKLLSQTCKAKGHPIQLTHLRDGVS